MLKHKGKKSAEAQNLRVPFSLPKKPGVDKKPQLQEGVEAFTFSTR